MGSRLNIATTFAYVAGFLDGDGSLMLQLKKRTDSARGCRFMATICFYQDTRHSASLKEIRSILGVGYIATRNDGMTELRINGFTSVTQTLELLMPYIRFKRIQVSALYKACLILSQKTFRHLSKKELHDIVEAILIIQNENYKASRKKTKEELYALLNLTP